MKDLQHLQREIGEWSEKQFGDNNNNCSKLTGYPMGSANALTGMIEELGELNHTTICYHQGRRGYDSNTEDGVAKYKSDRDDALADLMIFMCDYAYREGTDLLTILNQTWDKVVSKRTVQNWEEHTHEVKPVKAKNGRCMCSCGDTCPLGRVGMEERCTVQELTQANVSWEEETPGLNPDIIDPPVDGGYRGSQGPIRLSTDQPIPFGVTEVAKSLGATISERIMREEASNYDNEDDVPFKPEGEGWEFGIPDVRGDLEYRYIDERAEYGVRLFRNYDETENWGDETWWRLKPTEQVEPKLEQNGVGWAEIAEKVEERMIDSIERQFLGKPTYLAERERGNHYTRNCSKCSQPVHDSNSTEPLLCATCYKPPVVVGMWVNILLVGGEYNNTLIKAEIIDRFSVGMVLKVNGLPYKVLDGPAAKYSELKQEGHPNLAVRAEYQGELSASPRS